MRGSLCRFSWITLFMAIVVGILPGDAYTPADLAATIFHLLGVGPDAEFHDPEGRPYKMTTGSPIAPLVG